MKTRHEILGLLLGVATAATLHAAEYPPPAPGAGPELAEQLRSAVPAESTEYRGVLKTRKADGDVVSVPFTCRIIAGTPTWRVIYDTQATGTTPAERLVIIHATNGPNQYWFAKAPRVGALPGDPVQLKADQLTTPLAGSDFWVLDLGLDFLHWPAQRLIKTEMRKGRVCQVLESIQAQPSPGSYSRVLSWIDKETGGLILAEAYNREGRLLKEFSIRSFKKVEGRWQLEEMEIRDVPEHSRTRLEFDLTPAPGG